jgi:hypothetical protein
MTLVITSTELYGYAFVALFGLIVLRRAYRLTQGVRATSGRLIVLPVLYTLVFAGLVGAVVYGAAGSSLASEVYLSFGVDIALLVAGVFVAFAYTQRHVDLYRKAGATGWSYRINAHLPLLYVVLFFVRTGLEAAFLGLSPFSAPTPTGLLSLSPLSLYVLFLVDALWGLSTGFLVGRNAGVYHVWQQKLREAPGVPAPEPALP